MIEYIYRLNDKEYEVKANTPRQAYIIASGLYGKGGNIWEKTGYFNKPV